MPITLNHSNISVQYSSDKSYIIETVKSDLYRRNELIDTIVRDNLQTAPVTPSMYIENGTNNIYAVESYTYSGSANTADFTRVFTKSTTCDILIVGGGGGGDSQIGGGGGGGAVLHATNISIPANTYTIKVGKGGARNVNGGNSEAFGATCLGGGSTAYVAWAPQNNGASGGSGSGASSGSYINNNASGGTVGTSTKGTLLNSGTLYNGNIGGNGLQQSQATNNPVGSGGGGGAGSAGSSSISVEYSTRQNWIDAGKPGKGGDGVQINITGTTYYWGAGGGGGSFYTHAGDGGLGGGGGGGATARLPGLAGTGGINNGGNGSNTSGIESGGNGAPNTGSGGGGGGVELSTNGGTGGSGIVIIRYLLGTIPTTNLLTTEPVVVAPTFTETTRTFLHTGGTEAQTTHTITVGRDTICDILVVGGGGGGGKFGGGGGSGAILFASNLLLNTGTYTIKVGKGGLGVNTNTQNGNNGQDSSIIINAIEYIAKGGGGGGSRDLNSRGVSGNSGGSGGGGSHSNETAYQGLGGASNKNTYTGWLSYGNNGGKGRSGIVGSDPNHASGGGGGAGSAGGDTSNSTGGGNGGSGLNLSSTFGTSVGHSGWFGGGGGGGTYQGAGNPGYGNGGNGLLGGGGNGGFDGGTELSAQDGLPNTGGGGGGSKYDGGTAEDLNGGHGGSGIVIIKFKSTTPILEGITHKMLNFAFDSDATKSVEYQAQLKTGVGGWRIVRFLPPNINRWYQGNYISNSTFTIPTIGAPYNYTNEWAVPFGTFDEMVFGTLGMTYWLRCLKTSVLGTYDNAVRPIISSSFSSTPYSAIWYNRSYGIDPVISIQNYPTQVVYIEDNSPNDLSLLPLDGGMCVLVRDSATGTTIPNPNAYTLNFPVPTLADINNNSNIVLRGVYDLALSTSNALIIAKAGQYIPPPTTFTNYSIERMYPPVRNFTAATTIVSGQVYGNGTYVVSYSSTYGSGIDPWNSFNTANKSAAWPDSRYPSGVFNSTSFIVSGYLGDWLKIQLPVAIKLTRFEILMNTSEAQETRERSPKDFKIYGSNDNITWVELVNKTDAVYNASYKYVQTTPEITNTYTYYGLVVNKILSTVAHLLNFDEWYIYGQELFPSSLSLRYHLLNPTLDPIGAQWTYNSSNTNVYHMGRVGIGTTSPEYHLDVRGNIFSSTGGFTQSGLTTWSIASDRRIKENIVKASYEKCLENVKNIELYNFNFKDNYVSTNDRHQLGFIAQEVQQVYPKAVEVGKMMVNTNETIDNVLTLNTTQIKYTLYGAVKELINKVEMLETKINM